MGKPKMSSVMFYGILCALAAVIFVRQLRAGDLPHAVLCGVALFLFFTPAILEKSMKVRLPAPLAALLALSIFASAVLGEVQQFYLQYSHWDTVLHGADGFIMAAIGLALLDVLNHNSAFRFFAAPKCVGLFVFCFSMTAGLIWEFAEFFCDLLLGADMQKDILRRRLGTIWFTGDTGKIAEMTDIQQTAVTGYCDGQLTQWVIRDGYLDIGLLDTMQDLLACAAGAAVFVWLSYGYLKSRRMTREQKNWIPERKEEGRAGQEDSRH